jgi:hypothetical protein
MIARFLLLVLIAIVIIVSVESKYEWNAWQKAKEKQAAGDAPAWYAKTKETRKADAKGNNAWQRAKDKEANGDAPAWLAAVKEKTAEKQKAIFKERKAAGLAGEPSEAGLSSVAGGSPKLFKGGGADGTSGLRVRPSTLPREELREDAGNDWGSTDKINVGKVDLVSEDYQDILPRSPLMPKAASDSYVATERFSPQLKESGRAKGHVDKFELPREPQFELPPTPSPVRKDTPPPLPLPQPAFVSKILFGVPVLVKAVSPASPFKDLPSRAAVRATSTTRNETQNAGINNDLAAKSLTTSDEYTKDKSDDGNFKFFFGRVIHLCDFQ